MEEGRYWGPSHGLPGPHPGSPRRSAAHWEVSRGGPSPLCGMAFRKIWRGGPPGRLRGSKVGRHTLLVEQPREPTAGMWGRGHLSYQVVHLMVPSAGHKHHLASLLSDFQRQGTGAAVEDAGGGDIVRQTTVAIPQGFLLPGREEEPLFPPTDVDRPAEGAEDVGVEWGPAHELMLVLRAQSLPGWQHSEALEPAGRPCLPQSRHPEPKKMLSCSLAWERGWRPRESSGTRITRCRWAPCR